MNCNLLNSFLLLNFGFESDNDVFVRTAKEVCRKIMWGENKKGESYDFRANFVDLSLKE